MIDPGTNTTTGSIAVGNQPWGVAVSPTDGDVYIANGGDGTVSVIS